MEAHQNEMKHLNTLKVDAVQDWTLHNDVDQSVYWFSRTLKRSVREPPPGWTKNEKGKWVPPKKKDEL